MGQASRSRCNQRTGNLPLSRWSYTARQAIVNEVKRSTDAYRAVAQVFACEPLVGPWRHPKAGFRLRDTCRHEHFDARTTMARFPRYAVSRWSLLGLA